MQGGVMSIDPMQFRDKGTADTHTSGMMGILNHWRTWLAWMAG
jgi:hypothetical protein